MCIYTCFELAVKHGFSADKELVSDGLGQTEAIFEGRAVDGSNEWLAQWKLVDLSSEWGGGERGRGGERGGGREGGDERGARERAGEREGAG